MVIYNFNTKDVIYENQEYNEIITDVAWISANRFLSVDVSGYITAQDVNVEDSKYIKAHNEGIYTVLKQYNYVATCSVDTYVKVFNVKDLFDKRKKEPVRELVKFEGHYGYVTHIVWLSSDQLASGSFDGSVKIWSVHSKSCLFSLDGHRDRITALIKTGNYLVSGSYDGNVLFWEIKSGNLAEKFEGGGRITSLSASFDNSVLFVCSFGLIEKIKLKYNN